MDLEQILAMMDSIISDPTIPKNIRNSVSTAKEKILKSEDKVVGVAEAIYIIDEVSNDVNLPIHARPSIWSLLSALEAFKEEHKK